MSQTNRRPAAPDRRRHGRDDRGAVAVEFALVVLPLVVIFFGIIGFGFQFSQQLALSHAAREAARYASVASYGPTGWTPPTCAQVATRARDAARSMAIKDTSTITVTVTRDGAACGTSGGACTGASSTSSVKVRLSYASGIVLPFVPWNGNVSAEGVFRCEYS
jgi:Flp pilus assembly protein TadG